ncbi:nuclear receptor-interacting protein 1 [Kryptolebias marmoratus]|uniref:nuclear receptor-interacting protein 1 n=1 Tax=Kryptolebias marmoratus TaxID=37003 RepID=UPI0007F8FF24|nr:nuclear receptor-interacting protein 1 [Kryptolebias marmoratus]XP_037835130.1 nuclear receptor-interacting protein 1 [Kryptolebias marmoratus]XP_037835131.1 nuclear receptor-interacting protein 1 [Kryptolebias marmoratus]
MTHGEEPGPETHKDSAVLTYLEGLLMHPVVAGPGATAGGRSEAVHSNHEQGNKVGSSFPLTNHGREAPKAGTNGPTLGSSQHLKKARLLRSEAWNDPGNQRMSSPSVELNGQVGGLQNGTLEESPHAGESTLLASLLQSFSSRLQSVAMSQHSNKPTSECPSPSKAPAADREPLPVYGTASSHLKGLMRKSKLQNHNNTPYSRRGHSQDRPPESPRSAHSATPPAASTTAESVSCAERLKAVANMVKIRSSPAPSPKPSVACSQLALLLSSEAHLQQYSREHALKAQLSGRSASERLAAMANQQHGQDKRPPSVGGTPDTLSSLTTQNGMTTTTTVTTTLPRTAVSSPQSPSLLQSHNQSSPPTPPNAPSQPPREKRGFDTRPTRPPQTCSSLLLLLLNNHNNQKQLTKNGHLEDISDLLPQSGSSSVTSDSECSTHERSITKDNSDAESSYSSCSPIDLSMRGRGSVQDTRPKNPPPSTLSSTSTLSSSMTAFSSTPGFSLQATTQSSTTSLSPSSLTVSSASTATFSSSSSSSFSTSSLDKLTQSLLNKWKPEPSRSNVSINKDPEMSPDLKSQPKVTLMQLLLERKNNEMANKSSGKQDLPLDITMATMSRGQQKGLLPWEESRTRSPIERPVGPPQSLYSLSRDPSGALSPYSYPSPHVQSSPLDLCKSKTFPAEKASEPAFSASKLLQNLAQCGTTSSSSPPISSGKGLGQELDANRPLALLERLNAPLPRTTTTPLSDGASGSGTPFSHKEASPPSSQIENLLERRTVLQLLLGTGSAGTSSSRKDRPIGSDRRNTEVAVGCYEKSPSTSVLCDSSNGPLLDVKVKSEILEEVGPSSIKSEDLSSRKKLSVCEKKSQLSDSHQDFKTEPRPAEVVAKYGLLSQLLKQQTATYYTSTAVQAESQFVQVKEEQRDYPSPSPKRRCICPEQTDVLNNVGSPKAVDSGNTNMPASPTVQVELEHQRGLKEDEVPPSETLTRESRGFNVLKQLLLSDNCLKELSQQQRGAPSPTVLQANSKANGNILNQPAHNHNFLHLPNWPPHGSFNSGLPNHLRPLPSHSSGNSPIRTPWIRQPAPWPVAQKREPPTLVKQEPQSPVQWSSQENEGEEEGCESNPDSPRLSRSNPILYYMLQKGSIHLRKEARSQTEGALPLVRVKEEEISDMHGYECSLSSTPQSPQHNDKHSHESQGLSQSSQ